MASALDTLNSVPIVTRVKFDLLVDGRYKVVRLERVICHSSSGPPREWPAIRLLLSGAAGVCVSTFLPPQFTDILSRNLETVERSVEEGLLLYKETPADGQGVRLTFQQLRPSTVTLTSPGLPRPRSAFEAYTRGTPQELRPRGEIEGPCIVVETGRPRSGTPRPPTEPRHSATPPEPRHSAPTEPRRSAAPMEPRPHGADMEPRPRGDTPRSPTEPRPCEELIDISDGE